MKSRFLVSVLGAAAVMAATLSAQNMQLLVADSSSSGTYKSMLSEIKDVCESENFHIADTPQSGGAVENLDALNSNKVSAAFMHSDVIYSAAMADPSYRNLKTLVALYPEEIHVLTLRNSVTKPVGLSSYFSKPIQFNRLSDFQGWNVGAAGGGVITARILTGQGGGGFKVIPYGSGGDVLKALQAGEVQAAIFVGGAPLPNLSNLSADVYKLVPVDDTIASKLTGVYRPAKVNYTNLQSGSVNTLAPQALLVTRKYTIARLVAPQAAFRECFYKNLDEMKETPGKHPKWQLVDPQDHGVWEWYELPATTPSRSVIVIPKK